MFEVSLKLPKSHRKIQNGVNHPTSHNTKHFQQAVNKNKTRQYTMCIKFSSPYVLKFWGYNPNLHLIFVYSSFFCLQLETDLSVSCFECWTHFLWLQVFVLFFDALHFVSYWMKLKICGSDFYQLYFLEKPPDFSFLQNCSFIVYKR